MANTIKVGNVVAGTYHELAVIGRVVEYWRGVHGGKFYVVALDGPITVTFGTTFTITECLLNADEIRAWEVVDETEAPTKRTTSGERMCGPGEKPTGARGSAARA